MKQISILHIILFPNESHAKIKMTFSLFHIYTLICSFLARLSQVLSLLISFLEIFRYSK